MNKLEEIFKVSKPIIGKIHMVGKTQEKKIDRAIHELHIYEGNGVDGAILESCYSSSEDILKLLEVLKGSYPFPLGINILDNSLKGFEWAIDYGLKYVQFASVSQKNIEDFEMFQNLRNYNPHIMILGQIGGKLEKNVKEALQNSDAIVTTGEGISVDDLINLKAILPPDIPLIIGSGLNHMNAVSKLTVADAAIVGNYLRDGNTQNMVNPMKIHQLTNPLYYIREIISKNDGYSSHM